MQKKVYRTSIWFPIIGGIVFLFGCWAFWTTLNHLSAGETMLISGPGSSHSSPASPGTLKVFAGLSLCGPIAGCLCFWAFFNRRIVIDPEGLTSFTASGRTDFKHRYDELQRLEYVATGQNGPYYKLYAPGQHVSIGSQTARFEELVSEIMTRAPQLR